MKIKEFFGDFFQQIIFVFIVKFKKFFHILILYA